MGKKLSKILLSILWVIPLLTLAYVTTDRAKVIRLSQNSALIAHPRLSEYDEKCLRDAVKERVDAFLISELPASNPKFLLWGDSVVFRSLDPRLLNIENLLTIGLPGQQASCAVLEIDTILNIRPQVVILYFGANEADKGSKNVKEFETAYTQIVDTLIEADVQVYVHLIHFLDKSIRPRRAVYEINELLRKIASKRGLKIINSPTELDFEKSEQSDFLSYDGEMLTPLGYKVWFTKLQQALN